MKESVNYIFNQLKKEDGGFPQVAVTGGKGGTGKSTVAVLLGSFLSQKGKKVLLCDCDVEGPNDHLLLSQNLDKKEKTIFASYPELIKEKCKKCGLCAKNCRSNAVFQPPGKYPVFLKELCSSCGACWIVCPHGAIRAKEEKVGEVFVNRVNDGFWLVTGVAESGIEETGPIVAETKSFALEVAKKKQVDYVLLDTAPGIHCPVIAALMGADLAIAVTEPTPMGAHDLRLLLDLCRKMEIPFEVFLNQADLGNKKDVLKVVGDFNSEIAKEIPHSRDLVRAYSKGEMGRFSAEILLNN